ncbi:MAG: hypothetical protein GEU93_10515 [Propionibacteriales bacterium]|nr:hypothetical protein [Propionibacteriales bacterium]
MAAYLLGVGSSDPAGSAGTDQTAEQADQDRGDADRTGSQTSEPGAEQKSVPRQKPKPERRPRQEPPPPTRDVYVEVYNNSGVTGLAGSTAASLQDGGWQVVGIDDWYGNIPASTVYYPDSLAADARRLARELSIARVRGAVAPMKFDRLTVILTADTV